MCAARKSTTGCYAGGAGTATPSSGSPEDNQTEANNLDDNVQTVSRRSRSRKVRGKRRNTIAGIDQKEIQDAANGYVKINPNIDVYAELLASVFSHYCLTLFVAKSQRSINAVALKLYIKHTETNSYTYRTYIWSIRTISIAFSYEIIVWKLENQKSIAAKFVMLFSI